MPMSRCLKNDMRSDKSPKAGTKQPQGSNSDAPGTTRQFKQSGKKYSGPNYPKPDQNAKYGKTSLK